MIRPTTKRTLVRMKTFRDAHQIETIVVGGGQAGLAAGYYLKQQDLPFVILDSHARVGDAWRQRWDSLRLFSPAAYNGLAGMPFPAPRHAFVTKDEMADYLENYATHFALPVRNGVTVDRLWREGDRYRLTAGDQCFEADNVIVAMANYQQPRVPAFASRLSATVRQIHSSQYVNDSQLQDGPVLIVGAGNSGAEIAMELVRKHPVWLSGRTPGMIPFRIEGLASRLLLARVVVGGVFHHVLTVDTPVGRRTRANGFHRATPLIRVKPNDLAKAGVESVARVVGIEQGLPLLEDGRTLDAPNVIWATGFDPGFGWIDLPVFGADEPKHVRGVVPTQPGLYFVGLHFQYALSSSMVQGVSRDAQYVVRNLARRRADSSRYERGGVGIAAPEGVEAA